VSSTFAIFNGTELTKSNVYKIKIEQSKRISFPCTSTLISKYSFLTAAHCVDTLDLHRDIFINIGKDRFEVASIYIPLKYYEDMNLYNISKQKSVKYHRQLALNDIAIINFKKLLPKSYMMTKLSFDKAMVDSKVLAIGYGLTKYNDKNETFYNDPDFPHKRSFELSILKNNAFMVKGKSLYDYTTTLGDSGGPLYLKNTKIQIGVLRGSSPTKTKSASIYTPVRLHKNFILKYSK
jgi:V8-like Glu-specific endopeptidase